MHSMDEMCRAGETTRRGVRHWESQGLLGEVERTAGNTRRYTADQLDKAKIIAAAQFGGFGLDAIKDMLDAWGPNIRAVLLQRLDAQRRAAILLSEQLPQIRGDVAEYDL